MDRAHCFNCSFSSSVLIFYWGGLWLCFFSLLFFLYYWFDKCTVSFPFWFGMSIFCLILLLWVTTQSCSLMKCRLFYCKFCTTHKLFPRWILLSNIIIIIILCCLPPPTSFFCRVSPQPSLYSFFSQLCHLWDPFYSCSRSITVKFWGFLRSFITC